MKPLKIKVTQKDINYSNKIFEKVVDGGDLGALCPIARAIKRKLHKSVWVYEYEITILHNGRAIRSYITPPAVEKFINRFDRRKPVKPFEFELKDGW